MHKSFSLASETPICKSFLAVKKRPVVNETIVPWTGRGVTGIFGLILLLTIFLRIYLSHFIPVLNFLIIFLFTCLKQWRRA